MVQRNDLTGVTAGVSEQFSSAHCQHLLKVARSVARDARKAWGEMWEQYRPHIKGSGMIDDKMAAGFVPRCGWPAFLEQFWLLKHYLDCIDRICDGKQ